MNDNNDNTNDESRGKSQHGSTKLMRGATKQHLRCTGTVESTVISEFETVEGLVEAVESDRDLTDRDGIGPKTERAIMDWYDNRFERDETALGLWEPAFGDGEN